jgi:hypothetical protein
VPVSPVIRTAIVDCATFFTVAITAFIAELLTITGPFARSSGAAVRVPACAALIISSTEAPSSGNATTVHDSGGVPPVSESTRACAPAAVVSGNDTGTAHHQQREWPRKGARARELVGQRSDESIVAIESAELFIDRRQHVDRDHHRPDRDLIARRDARASFDRLAVLLRAVRTAEVLDPQPVIVPLEARMLARESEIVNLDVRWRRTTDDQRAALFEMRGARSIAVIEDERRARDEHHAAARAGVLERLAGEGVSLFGHLARSSKLLRSPRRANTNRGNYLRVSRAWIGGC